MKRFALAAFLVFVVGACGSFGSSQPHTLSLAFKAADTYKYKFHATSKQTAAMAGMSIPLAIDVTAGETVTVKSVDSAGTADVTISFSGFTTKTSMGGVTNTTTGGSTHSVDVQIRNDGTVVAINGEAMRGLAGAVTGLGGGFFIAAVLPDHAVKAGDTWSKTYDEANPDGDGSVHIVSDSKYLRDESVAGVNAAVVETKSTGTIDVTQKNPAGATKPGISMTGTFTTDVTTWIDPSGHRVVKSHSIAHDDLTIQLPANFTIDNSSSTALQGPVTAKGDATTDLTAA